MRLEKTGDQAGREAVGFFKHLGKMIGIAEAGSFGRFLDAEAVVPDQQEGALAVFEMQQGGWADAEFLFEEIIDVLRQSRKTDT
nr:hypothetical protein [Tichowtungia aerotolerans]